MMEVLLIFLILICAAVLTTYIFTIQVPWEVHVSMVKQDNSSYGKANYKKFVEEFNKVDWAHDSIFKGSLFSSSRTDKYHASIIKFNGKGMIINNPFSYIRVERHVKRYIKEHFDVGNTVKEWR